MIVEACNARHEILCNQPLTQHQVEVTHLV